jgi:glycosyltransferase involved in cell wall biosynthesis
VKAFIMRVALVYDRVNKWGGAERVLLALNKLFPKAPLFTSVYNKKNASWADIFDIRTSFLQKLPLAKDKHELFPLLMPTVFESFNFDEYDLVISVSSEAAKGIITKPHTKHIFYCLTPTRYLWSGYDTYFSNKAFKAMTKPAVEALRKWDKIAAHRPDVVIAISEEVQGRIKKYYGRDSFVIHPPVSLGNSKSQQNTKYKIPASPASTRGVQRGEPNTKYFLIVSRLSKFTRYKRVDLAIEAFTHLGLPLKIVGVGSLEKELKKKAGPTIEFLGNLTDEKLIEYYKNCSALIFPGLEDFGLVMAEAQKHGKPVIAFAKGGALDIVIEGETGYFFTEQTKESLVKALQKFEKYKFDPTKIRKNAEKFSFENFSDNFQKVVKSLF